MGIHNNTPTVTWLKIEGTTITHDNKVYMVEDLKTNLEYIYWELDNPYKLRATNMNLGTSGTRFLILKNNSGDGILVPNDNILVSFDGNSIQMTEDKVYGLVEKVDEHSGKFVTVEQDVNGIKQNVGSWSNDNGTISENISSIKETAENIDLSVKDLDKTFNDNKAVNELREKINKSIIDFNAELGVFNDELSGFFKDNIVSPDESAFINTYLSVIDNKVSEIVLNIDTAISLADIQGQTTHKNAMISEKDVFVTSVSNLKNYITSAISDNVFTTADVTGIVNMFSKCNMKISSLKNTVDDFIFLGSGGKVIEELARIGIKSNEIILSVSNTEESLKTVLGIEKNILQGNIADVKNANYDLKSKFDSIASDGSASLEEKTIISDAINKLNTEKNDVVNKYNELYSNIYISINIKNELKIEFDNFNNKSIETISKINDVILDGFINDAEKNQVDTLLNEYIIKLISLQSKMSQSIDDIEKNTVKAEIQKAKDDLQIEIGEVSNAINNLQNTMDGAFKDGVLSDSEKNAIKQNLQTIGNEKADVDNGYPAIYNNAALIGDAKTNLLNAYNEYISKYNLLVVAINNILNKVELVDSTDQINLNNAFVNYRTSSGVYSQRINEAIDSIASKKATDAETNAKNHTDAKVTVLQDSIDLKVSNDKIISAINLSPETIQISSSKINISGLVTFTDLNTSGATIIHGDNILSGTIKGARLQTYANDSSKGVRIEPESIQLNDTSIFFDSKDGGKFKIQATNNIGISSINDVYIMPRINSDGTPSYNGYLNIGGHCKAVSLTSNETMKLYNTTLYSPYSGYNHQCDVLKLGGINLGAVSSSSIHLITTGGAKANLYANFFGTINGITPTGATTLEVTKEPSIQEQLLQESFTSLDTETDSIMVNINDATIENYKKNKELEKENAILKQTQIEQDQVTIENAYQIALIQLP